MPQVINTNVSSLNAQRNLNKTQGDLTTSLQRLSTGLRINSAKDDAAGLAISERMTAQIRGLNQAVRNANDGISLSQTAESTLGTISDSLLRIREIAIQSANATNSSSDRTALQSEVNQRLQEVNRVLGTTEFNGLNLFDGSFTSQQFQVGANANQTIGISIQNLSSTTMFTGYDLNDQVNASANQGTGSVVTSTGSGIGANSGIAAQTLSFTSASGSLDIAVALGASAKQVAADISASEPTHGVIATATTSGSMSALDFASFNMDTSMNSNAGQGSGAGNLGTGGFTSSIGNQTLTFRLNGSVETQAVTAGESAKTVAANVAANISGVTAASASTYGELTGLNFSEFTFATATNATANEGTGSAEAYNGVSLSDSSNSSIASQTLTFRDHADNSLGTAVIADGASAKDVAAAINGAGAGVSGATATTNVALSQLTAGSTISFNFGSSDGGGLQGTGAILVGASGDLSALHTAINGNNGLTSVLSGVNNEALTITDADGSNIIISDFTTDQADPNDTMFVQTSDGDSTTLDLSAGDTAVVVSGVLDGNLTSTDYFSIESSVANSAGSVLNVAQDTEIDAADRTVTFTLNASDGGSEVINAVMTHDQDLTALEAAISGNSLGITSNLTGSVGSHVIELTDADGDSIAIENLSLSTDDVTLGFNGEDTSGGTMDSSGANDSMVMTGVLDDIQTSEYMTIESDASPTVGDSILNAAASTAVGPDNRTVSFQLGTGPDGSFESVSATFNNDKDLLELVDRINDHTGATGITATISGTAPSDTEVGSHVITLTDADGDNIVIEDFDAGAGTHTATVTGTDGGASTLTTGVADSAVFAGDLSLDSHKAFTVSSDISAAAGSVFNADADTALSGIVNDEFEVSVDTQARAQDTIEMMDAALDLVNSVRGDLGAVQNRFESAINNMAGISENLSASRSRIRDADFAQETAQLTKAQILQQAGISILSQANALPQNALALLQ